MSLKSRTHFLTKVYLQSTGTCVGPDEHQGPLGNYFDHYFEDYYGHEKTFEKAERKMQQYAIKKCLQKIKMDEDEIDLFISADLTNQITCSSYNARELDVPYLGIYGACSSSCLGLAIASLFVEGGFFENILVSVSSHNATAERQYRYPVEYGIQKPETTTFTATGCGAAILSNQKSEIQIECVTLGRVVDLNQTNVNDMGRAMAPAAYDTLKAHFADTARSFKDYDLVVTGDLSYYGKQILVEMFKEENQETNNYNDCGLMLYDIHKQDVFLGGSGCACSALVTFGYLVEEMKKGRYKKVLVVATGALMSPITIMQKESIPAVAHAISLEVKS